MTSGRLLEFDLLRETWERTNFQEADVGAAVNLERSLQLQDRFGGHFVTGHIDGEPGAGPITFADVAKQLAQMSIPLKS